MYALRRFAVRRSRQFEWVYQRLESLLVSLDPLLSKLGYARLERPVAAVERVTKARAVGPPIPQDASKTHLVFHRFFDTFLPPRINNNFRFYA